MENQFIEINGIKMEVDARTATIRKIDSFKIGDPVKLLLKTYNGFDVKYAVIIGFDEFKTRPTITLAYLEHVELKYAQIYKGCENEITPVQSHDLVMEKTWIIDRMKDQIVRKEQELAETKSKLEHFQKFFGKYFENGIPDVNSITA